MNIENSIPVHLGKTVKLLDHYIEDRLAIAGIPLSRLQFVFLMIISKNDGAAQCTLAELTERDKTTYTRNIKTLESKKFVTRKPSLKDKRVNLVHITPLGSDLLQKARLIVGEVIKEVESDFSAQEKELLIITLDKIKSKVLQIRNQSSKLK